MKLSVGLLASLVAAEESVSVPVNALHGHLIFSRKLLRSGAFDHKPDMWRDKWDTKFRTNAIRMEESFGRCGFYDADIHTFNYEYDNENACNGIKIIMDGFSRWSDNHLGRCNSQRKHNFNRKRLVKWGYTLARVLKCETKVSSYTFVIPVDDWYMYEDNENGEMGESLEFSTLCNPNFKDSEGGDCKNWYGRICHKVNAGDLVQFSVVNENGIRETGLNCPECGCGAFGAANLNDVYADKGRKASAK